MAQDPAQSQNSKNNNSTTDSNVPCGSSASSASTIMNQLHRAVVAGATGSIGRHCVYLLVRDPRVESVTALTRGNGKDASFYGLDSKNGDDLSKLHHLSIDYTKDIYQQFKDGNNNNNNINNFTIGLSGIGVYTEDVKNEQDFFDRDYTPNINIATAAAKYGVKNWGYLSGQGVDIREKKGWFQAMFSWVKGCTERDLSKIKEFEYVATFRPGGILGRPNDKSMKGLMGWVEDQTRKYQDTLVNYSMFIHRDDISKAMVHGILTKDNNNNKYQNDNSYNITIFENQDLKDKAKQYDTQLEQLLSMMSKKKESKETKNENVNNDNNNNDDNK